MPIKYGKKKNKKYNVFYTVITALLICAVFLSMVNFFYNQAEDEAYEMLHIQTKQIKDDLTLQIKSDRENLVTMANFASKLYADGESYDLMFESFKPIGLFSNIGILNPDNTFVTKKGSIDLNGKISFEEEAIRGEYISGRVPDLTKEGNELVRSAVPIKLNSQTVGILYGVIKLQTINEKYIEMARGLDAQLFVYDKENGNYIIDSVHRDLSNISDLKTRKYNNGYSYEDIVSSDKGYSSFESIYKDETLYVHYSTLENVNWGIMLARYESQVFEKAQVISNYITVLFFLMLFVVALFLLMVLKNEKRDSLITKKASETRKLLLDINEKKDNIAKALKNIKDIALSKSALFVDIEGEDNCFTDEGYNNRFLKGDDRRYFISELFRYAVEFKNVKHINVAIMGIKPDNHLFKTNPEFYQFLKNKGIKKVIFSAVTSAEKNDNLSILAVINPKNRYSARVLLEDISVCFSIAIYNKNHLNKTYTAATTDSLTNVFNRVAYKKDIISIDEEMPEEFSCIYIDVNELHIINNKYGHAAGDEMLIFIANSLKNTFYGHKIYRMGGDEFLVFANGADQEYIRRSIDVFTQELETKNYHVAIGVSYRTRNSNTEDLVREAEKRMYEVKAQYYQSKEKKSVSNDDEKKYKLLKTGILEIDAMLSVLKEHYNGIYRVSLETDIARRILMPSYLGYKETEENFSKLLSKYIEEIVHPDYNRSVMSFLNYDAIKRQLSAGETPKISFKKNGGENVILSVYKLGDGENINDTLWIFAKG
ncbi:MAG: GGDEF domain-containing protein [Clostridia bacterium]|nr:GGDEF domain-containing protein [Clostridia bacterium]